MYIVYHMYIFVHFCTCNTKTKYCSFYLQRIQAATTYTIELEHFMKAENSGTVKPV